MVLIVFCFFLVGFLECGWFGFLYVLRFVGSFYGVMVFFGFCLGEFEYY